MATATEAGTLSRRPTSTAGTSSFWTDTVRTSTVAAILDGGPVPLPGTPLSVRPAAGLAGRPAVEIYAAGSVLDVMVAPALDQRVLAPGVLRGACSLACAGQHCAGQHCAGQHCAGQHCAGQHCAGQHWAGQPCAVAWGFLPACPGLSVWFTGRLGRSRCFAAPVSVIAGSFWVAPAEGRFREVTVEYGDGRDRCRVRTARPC